MPTKTTIIEVAGLLSVLSDLGVEKHLPRLPGVKRVDVDYVTGSTTVVYREKTRSSTILTSPFPGL
jgi:P-type Cu2+ transporter